MPRMNGALSTEELELLRKDFSANPAYRLTQNAVTRVRVDDVAINREIINNTDHFLSTLLDDWKVTNQERSGRCWLFAGLNLLRVGAMKKMGLKEFEFSQNYAMFWDKLERANYFLEAIIETAGRDLDDRTVAYLLDTPAEDGGQWNMFVAIVAKHGLVRKAFAADGTEAARAAKAEVLRVVHRVLCIHLGAPPERFDWQWTDKDREFHRDGMLTPREFAARYVDLPIDDYVCLVNDPRPSSPAGRTFTVEYLGNVIGAPPVTYLNVAMPMIKDYGVWDARLYDFPAVYDTTFGLDKAGRLLYHETQMTHAMLFTGVDVLDGATRKWRVENSWGADKGKDGFYTMNDSWFDEYVFEIAARRSALPADLQAALDTAPIVLPAWDPMGALAR